MVEPMVEPAAAQAAQAKAQESGRGQSEAMDGVLDCDQKSESSELELMGANFVHTGMHLIDAVQRSEVRQHAEATLGMPLTKENLKKFTEFWETQEPTRQNMCVTTRTFTHFQIIMQIVTPSFTNQQHMFKCILLA